MCTGKIASLRLRICGRVSVKYVFYLLNLTFDADSNWLNTLVCLSQSSDFLYAEELVRQLLTDS